MHSLSYSASDLDIIYDSNNLAQLESEVTQLTGGFIET